MSQLAEPRYVIICDEHGWAVYDTYTGEPEQSFTDIRNAYIYCDDCNWHYCEAVHANEQDTADDDL